jgi:hypothetical protein
MKKYTKSILLSFVLLAVPAVVFATGKEVAFLPEEVEEILEVVNLLLALLAATFAIKLAALSQGGELEKTWNILAMAAVTFAGVEVIGALKEFELVEVAGLGEILELTFVALLCFVFYRTRKNLLKRVLGK